MGANGMGYAMAIGGLGQAASTLITASAQSNAIEMQGEFQKQQFEINTRLAELSAADAIRRGDRSARNYKKQVKQTIGAQRVALAAQGIQVDSGSALEVQADTARTGELEVLTIKNNAFREAWGYKMEAISQTAKGQFAGISSAYEAQSTMLSGGLNSLSQGIKAGSYLDYGKTTTKDVNNISTSSYTGKTPRMAD